MKRKHLVFAAVLAALLLVAGYYYYYRVQSFAELLPFPVEEIVRFEVVEELGENRVMDLTEEQAAHLLALLGQNEYKRDGSSSALQGCYARLFLWTSERDHIEVMLSPEYVLVNTDFGTKPRSPVYAVTDGGGAVADYLNDCFKAADTE